MRNKIVRVAAIFGLGLLSWALLTLHILPIYGLMPTTEPATVTDTSVTLSGSIGPGRIGTHVVFCGNDFFWQEPDGRYAVISIYP